jgi:hypothetical protein
MAKTWSIQGILSCLLAIVVIITIPISILACFGAYNENCELLTHFRLQYLLVSMLFLGWAAYFRRPKTLLLAVAWFIYLALPVMPYYLPLHDNASKSSKPLKIL